MLYPRVRSRADGTVELTLATGGHLPRASSTPTARSNRSSCAVRSSAACARRLRAIDVVLAPGDVLVLFTDGVTELRGHDPGEGERLLDELLATCGGLDPVGMVEAVEARAVELPRAASRATTSR